MLDYNLFVQKAQRCMIKDILNCVAQEGLEEPNHFLITFQTNRNDVVIPDFVRSKYPEEITIVLQYQFENLVAKDDCFCVDLTFGGVLSTLIVPYNAIKQFVDPSSNFGFALDPVEEKVENNHVPGDIIDLERYRKK